MIIAVAILSSLCVVFATLMGVFIYKFVQTEKMLNLAVRALLDAIKEKDEGDVKFAKVSFPSKDGF